jgi:hypothetical protein
MANSRRNTLGGGGVCSIARAAKLNRIGRPMIGAGKRRLPRERPRRTPIAARRTHLALALIAAVIVAISVFANLRALATMFLVAYASVVSVALGTVAIALIAQLTTATWFRPFRAPAERILAALPALALFGVLLLLALPVIYPWFGAALPARAYLNGPFFIVRFVIYWATWILIARALRRPQRPESLRRIASTGLIVLGLTMTFASFDWMMSLTPGWHSTIYGVYWFAGGILGALALLAVMLPGDGDAHALAKLMLTFVLFWLYVGFSQYIVMWSGDIPREVAWYLPRTRGGWGAIAALLIFGNFAFPFLVLLIEPVKRAPKMLGFIGAVLLLLHYLDTFWIVAPGVIAMRWWTPFTAASVLLLMVMALRLAERA